MFEALLKSPAAQQALGAWMPPSSGLRERLARLTQSYPQGFQPTAVGERPMEAIDHDLAEWELRRHLVLQRARMKLRAVHNLQVLGRARHERESQRAAES